MRPEVQQAIIIATLDQAYLDQHGALSPAAHANLDQHQTLMMAVWTCLHSQPMLSEVQRGTTWSISIEWGVPKAQIVLEVSRYGHFAALFPYGEPPNIVLRHAMLQHHLHILSARRLDTHCCTPRVVAMECLKRREAVNFASGSPSLKVNLMISQAA